MKRGAATVAGWQAILARMLASPEIKRVLIEKGINATTLARWVHGESKPRETNVRLLLEVCPVEERDLLVRQLQDAELLPAQASQRVHDIPSEFYGRVLDALATSPDSLRYLVICQLVLRQALRHLDPQRKGLVFLVTRCLPPASEGIRSLQTISRMGTPPWGQDELVECSWPLFGAESIVGKAAVSFQTVSVGNVMESPVVRTWGVKGVGENLLDQVGGGAAVPLLRAGRVAGCLLAVSAQHPVPVVGNQVLKEYAKLLSLAFFHQEFYDRAQLALALMPSLEQQRHLFESLEERVVACMKEAQVDHASASLRALQDVETDLIRLVKP